MIQNPESYLIQKKDSDSAIVMKNATFSWSQPESPPSTANGVKGHKVEDLSQNGKTETLSTLRNISFTLPKVGFTTDTYK